MTTQAVSTSSWSDYFTWIPVLNPALKSGSCEVDHSLLISRICVIGLAILALSVASQIYPSAAAFLSVLRISLLFLIPLDACITERAADVKAVNEYLNMNYPTKQATWRIQGSLSAAQLLVSQHGDVNKINEEGDLLLSYIRNLNVFKHLVDCGADLKRPDRYEKSMFSRIVGNPDLAFLEYALSQNRVTPHDFTPEQQVDFWLQIGNLRAGQLLARHGFNVNIKNAKGFTPLLKLVSRDYHHLSPVAHVRMLLECGADKSITVNEQGQQKNALQLAINPAVREIL